MTRHTFAHRTTPVGEVFLGFADDRLLTLHLLDGDDEAVHERFARAADGRVDRDEDADHGVGGQLDEYFDGTRRRFEIGLDWSLVHGFTRAALRAICDIPYGETAGYGEVAVLAGSPRAARAVGSACAGSPFSIVVPVHRVVRADGSYGQYGGRPEVKRFLLDLEARAVAQTGAGA